MKPPFQLPVEKKPDFKNEDLFRVESADGLFLSFSLKEDEVDYIVTAINSHEKSAEAIDEIETVSCGEKQIESDGVYDDSDGLSWIYKRIQALKEAEKQ